MYWYLDDSPMGMRFFDRRAYADMRSSDLTTSQLESNTERACCYVWCAYVCMYVCVCLMYVLYKEDTNNASVFPREGQFSQTKNPSVGGKMHVLRGS